MPSPSLLTEGGVFAYPSRDAVNQLIAAQGILSQGNVWWVRPINGSDINNGLSPATAFATLAAAQNAAVANQNDVVLLCAENNTASGTTNYQSDVLIWAKNLVHLIGVNSNPTFGQRSRVALAAASTTSNELFRLSGNGCKISGIEFFMGVASVNPIGCMNVTGQRNHIIGCQIAGMGATTNDISGSYSLAITGGAENVFEDCAIGQNTVQLGAGTSNSVILFASGATRNIFKRCIVQLNTSSATACLFLRAVAGSMDRFQYFIDTIFENVVQSGSTTLTHGMAVAASGSPSGGIVLAGTTGMVGASGWNTTNAGNIYAVGGVQPTAGSWGLATAVTG